MSHIGQIYWQTRLISVVVPSFLLVRRMRIALNFLLSVTFAQDKATNGPGGIATASAHTGEATSDQTGRDCEPDDDGTRQVMFENVGAAIDQVLADKENDGYLPEWNSLTNEEKTLGDAIMTSPKNFKNCTESLSYCKSGCAQCKPFDALDTKLESSELKSPQADEAAIRHVDKVGETIHTSSVSMHQLFIDQDPFSYVEGKLQRWLSTNIQGVRLLEYTLAVEISRFLLYAMMRSLGDPALSTILGAVLAGVAVSKLQDIYFDLSKAIWTMTGDTVKANIHALLSGIYSKLPSASKSAAFLAVKHAAVQAGAACNRWRRAVDASVASGLKKSNRAMLQVAVQAHQQAAGMAESLKSLRNSLGWKLPETPKEFGNLLRASSDTLKDTLLIVWKFIKSPIQDSINQAKSMEGAKEGKALSLLTEQWLAISVTIVKTLLLEPASALLVAFLYLEFTIGRLGVKLLVRAGKGFAKTLMNMVTRFWNVMK